MDAVTDECRPAAGAEHHWFKHNDHGYRLYERISGTALGTFWMYRDFGGKSETLAAEGWTYHAPASPDDATERARLEGENARLRTTINTPVIDDWFAGVRNEAAHQVERWGSSHDAGKAALDWFWLIGYLAQKVVSAETPEKALHHTISTAAALFNWHQAISGADTRIRPGIEPPAALTPGDAS